MNKIEELEVLHQRLEEGDYTVDEFVELQNLAVAVLPQLLAVVRAAEEYSKHLGTGGSLKRNSAEIQMVKALAALESEG